MTRFFRFGWAALALLLPWVSRADNAGRNERTTLVADAPLPFADRLAAATETFSAQALAPYALDDLPRTVAARGKLACPDVPMTRTRGTHVSYGRSLTVASAFLPRLMLIEEAIVVAAKRVYGRAPRSVESLGTLNCRRMRLYPTYVSEHGVGNAIDIAAFSFAPARGAERAAAPPLARGAFTVDLEKHWQGGSGLRALHQQFLQELVLEILRRDAVRVLLGPAYPGHKNHFHFDMSPFRLVEI